MNVSITPGQRRMAAAALRSLGRRTMPVVSIVGTVADAYGGRPDASPVESLADLVDWPTCRNVSGCQDKFECSECRCKVEIVGENGNEYGDVFSTPLMPHYCPHCGAEVVDDDD